MTYILLVAWTSYQLTAGYTITEIKTKTACEAVVTEIKKLDFNGLRVVKCIESK